MSCASKTLGYAAIFAIGCIERILLTYQIGYIFHRLDAELETNLVASYLSHTRIAYYDNPKTAAEFLAHTTLLAHSKNDNLTFIKNYVTGIYQALETDPLLKYVCYVNAVENANEQIFDHPYIPARFPSPFNIHIIHDKDPAAQGQYNTLQYSFLSAWEFIIINYNDTVSYDTVAHEMSHKAYNVVYRNAAEPFSNNTLGQSAYQIAFNSSIKYLAAPFSQDFKRQLNSIDQFPQAADQESNKLLVWLAAFKLDTATALATYKPESYSKEMIAYYLGNRGYIVQNIAAAETIEDALDQTFPGFKDFFITYSIPEFKNYIETHPNCHRLAFDDTITCQGVVEDARAEL